MGIDDEIEISITVKYIPNGKRWKSETLWKDGKLQTTKFYRLPVRLINYELLTRYILDIKQEIENELQTTR